MPGLHHCADRVRLPDRCSGGVVMPDVVDCLYVVVCFGVAPAAGIWQGTARQAIPAAHVSRRCRPGAGSQTGVQPVPHTVHSRCGGCLCTSIPTGAAQTAWSLVCLQLCYPAQSRTTCITNCNQGIAWSAAQPHATKVDLVSSLGVGVCLQTVS